ncbi:MAG: hypothetical protein J7J32_05270 [Candidatus Atribacteria bacterium]|nr:hypothetical protein [Candidatus Atribacteria bacterium]MCD6349672.1 hypothetical protein [Candidatus Atribacteria bacterium]
MPFERLRKLLINKFPADRRDIGAFLQEVGKAIIFSGAAAAMGPLYGTSFIDVGKAVVGKEKSR